MLYKNISTDDQHLVAIGTVAKGETIETDIEIANQNFELQEVKPAAKVEETPVKTEDKPSEEK